MATYLQWNRSRLVRPVTWACGPEWALAHEVELQARHDLATLPILHSIWAEAATEPRTWDYLLETPPAGGRLVIVHDAQNLAMTDRMAILLDSRARFSYVLFISDEEDFARIESGGKKVLAPHLAAIKDSKDGQLIRCCKPSRDEDVLRLIASWWPDEDGRPAGLNFASALLARCGGQLGAVYVACQTAKGAAFPPEEQWLDMACQSVPQAKYADELLAGHRKVALEEAAQLSDAEAASVLKLLGSRLSAMVTYNALRARDMDPEQIARHGIARWQQSQLAPYAARYAPSKVIYCRKLLAMAEDAFRSGVRDGLLQAVAALW